MQGFKRVVQCAVSGVLLLLGLMTLHCTRPVYPACEGDDDCVDHQQVCSDRQCVECRTDLQCSIKLMAAATCKENKCALSVFSECKKDSDCSSTQLCRDKKCVVNSGSECQNNNDCAIGEECLFGKCRMSEKLKASSSCFDPKQKGKMVLRNIYFDYDKFELDNDNLNALKINAECLKLLPPRDIVVEGHSDERGTVEYNFSLSEKRGRNVVKYLELFGVVIEKMQILPKGKSALFCTDLSEECHSKNRRVEFK